MNLSLNILSYNRDDIIEKNINNLIIIKKKLEEDTLNKVEINIVDNLSTDNTKTILKKFDNSCVNIIHSLTNSGVAKGRNQALRKSLGDWHFILDDDSIISLDAVEKFINYANDNVDNNIGIVALNILEMRTEALLSNLINIESCEQFSNFGGGAFVINNDLLTNIGGMDELCTFGGEELDYSIRCIDAGFKMTFLKEAVIHHYGKDRTGAVLIGRRKNWLFNYVRVLFKHFPFPNNVIYSSRYFVLVFANAFRTIGPFKAFLLFPAFINAIKEGRRMKKIVKESTVKYYSYPNMLPEFGNIPLYKKIINKLKAKD